MDQDRPISPPLSEQNAAPRFHVVLHEPRIPPNTGNILRLCAVTGSRLHLVGPLGFRLDAAAVRRAGMDYREWADVTRHDHWRAFREGLAPGTRLLPISTHGERTHDQVRYAPGDHLLFGSEDAGLPREILEELGGGIRIPMLPRGRSLNLAVSVAVVLYEALRQNRFPGLG